MLRNWTAKYYFAFCLLEFVNKIHIVISGLVNTNMRFFDENLSNIQEEISSIMSDLPLKFQLKFEPSYLDFKQRSLGVPHMEKVILRNTNKNKSIYMTSISGSSVHFHSSFFEDKKIPPNGTTSFNVVFLGREEGYVESNLFIHTSEGFLKYNVGIIHIYLYLEIYIMGLSINFTKLTL
nr:unnamed protein product [Callosobruchus analis]